MITLIRNSWSRLFNRKARWADKKAADGAQPFSSHTQIVEFDITPNDPLLAYLLSVSSAVDLERLKLESPALRKLKEAGVKLVVPLISQGELIGLLNLGPRRSEQDYSADDRRLLNTLAAQAAPALRVAQLARQQQAEARERERLAHEMRVARVIQQTLLPKEIPALPGWQMAAHWQPARAVSGDFYDFIQFPDGCLGIIVGDVTDKGVPAALVMATTRSVLRASAEQLVFPGVVLEQVNNTLCPDIPLNMFVTCLYALLDPVTRRLRFANAGHNLPYQRTTSHRVLELRARGMPLGLMPGMTYEEKEVELAPGDQVIFYSDGIVEAHNTGGEMFGFPRLRELLAQPTCASEMISCLVSELAAFTGPAWEQEDDVTFVSLSCEEIPPAPSMEGSAGVTDSHAREFDWPEQNVEGEWRALAEFTIASQPGNERQAMERVGEIAVNLGLSAERVERLKTAVAETTMNAMEHGNHYSPDLPVEIIVIASPAAIVVRIRDHGVDQQIVPSEEPDLDAKLAGMQSPRGWGLFLIKNMVDEMRVSSDETHHIVDLYLQLTGEAK